MVTGEVFGLVRLFFWLSVLFLVGWWICFLEVLARMMILRGVFRVNTGLSVWFFSLFVLKE